MSAGNRKVLIVDDDVNLLSGLRRQFRNDFDLHTTASASEALEMIAAENPFAVVLSDYQMPEMDGVGLLQRVRHDSPDTITIMLTGLADLEVAVSALHQGGIFRFLHKPCPAEIIRDAIKDGIERYRLVVAERQLTADLNSKNQQLQELNEQLEERVNRRTAMIHRLHEFVTNLNGLDTLEDVADLVVATAIREAACRRGCLMLPDKTGQSLRVIAANGLPENLAKSLQVPVGRAISGRVFAEVQPVVLENQSELEEFSDRADAAFFDAAPLVSTVLVSPSGPIGVLNVADPEDGRPLSMEALAGLRAVADAAAIALRNQIRLLERNEARDAVIVALATLAEYRDPETGAHLQRVQAYCRLLSEALAARKYGRVINRAFIEAIVHSSPLHDIGKVGTPDHILLKPGRLTPEEFEVMKRHAVLGGDAIRDLIVQGRAQPFLQMGMEIAYHHHEKYDGSGYPAGLAGQDIPLPARIMALADVYDALTSRRPYKEPMPHERAAAIIREGRGRHFDPDVADAFDAQEAAFQHMALTLKDDGASSKSGSSATHQTEDLAAATV